MMFTWHYPIMLFRHLMFRRMIHSLATAGLELGKNVTIMPGVEFDATYPFLISIGDGSAVSSGVRILAHDASIYPYVGMTRIGRVLIRENCLIGERSIILPDVAIGPNSMVAAGSVVNRDIPPDSVAAGNPARIYGKMEDFLRRHIEASEKGKITNYRDLFKSLDAKQRTQWREELDKGHQYVSGEWSPRGEYGVFSFVFNKQ